MTSPQDVVVATWREQSARIVGGLLRLTRDVGLAEDLAHDAMLAALEQWPTTGVPDSPGAWLMTVAQRRAVDHHRRAERYARAQTRMAHELLTGREDPQVPDPAAPPDPVQDDVLQLVLVTCHPALTVESQVALTLRLVGGLTSREIARALLVPEATVVRRITRAKTALAELARSAGRDDAPFEVPPGGERERLPAVMGVVYLVFTEGYAATSGEDWIRGTLCAEAVRLARLLAQLVPDEPEVHGLLALLELQGSRAVARTDADGAPVLLEDQDAPGGTSSPSAAGSIRWGGPWPWGRRVRTRCRRRSRRATRGPPARPPPTGRPSRGCTTRWPAGCGPRSCW